MNISYADIQSCNNGAYSAQKYEMSTHSSKSELDYFNCMLFNIKKMSAGRQLNSTMSFEHPLDSTEIKVSSKIAPLPA